MKLLEIANLDDLMVSMLQKIVAHPGYSLKAQSALDGGIYPIESLEETDNRGEPHLKLHIVERYRPGLTIMLIRKEGIAVERKITKLEDGVYAFVLKDKHAAL